jgi:Tol biopolymer transport system component
MKSRPGQENPHMFKNGWAWAAALSVLAVTLACSVSANLPSQPTQAPVQTQPPGQTQPPAQTQASAETHTPAQTLIPVTGAAPGLIAYSGTDGNIYTIGRDGKQQTAITQDAGQAGRVYQNPTWAPDGQTLAFLGFIRSDQAGTQAASLYTASADGKKRVEAFTSQDSFPFYLFWSPNSQYVTFLSNATSGTDLALNMAAAAGGESKVIATGQPFYWDWSPDNRAIIAHTGGAASDNSAARMALFQLDGSIQKTELDLKPGSFQAPAWSPAGDEMVLTTENAAGGQELVVAGRDGSVKHVLAQLSGTVAFAWSPKGDNLAYTAQAEGDTTGQLNHLVLLDPAQPDRKKEIARGLVVAFFWSPDSQKVAYFTFGPQNQGQTSQVLFQNNPQITLAVQVYDLASGNIKQVAAIAPTDAFQQVLPYFDQYQRSGTIWSPDSKSLVLSSVEASGNSAIFVVGADGSKFQKIADGDLAFWSWK